jgi:hypothetical protein
MIFRKPVNATTKAEALAAVYSWFTEGFATADIKRTLMRNWRR